MRANDGKKRRKKGRGGGVEVEVKVERKKGGPVGCGGGTRD